MEGKKAGGSSFDFRDADGNPLTEEQYFEQFQKDAESSLRGLLEVAAQVQMRKRITNGEKEESDSSRAQNGSVCLPARLD